MQTHACCSNTNDAGTIALSLGMLRLSCALASHTRDCCQYSTHNTIVYTIERDWQEYRTCKRFNGGDSRQHTLVGPCVGNYSTSLRFMKFIFNVVFEILFGGLKPMYVHIQLTTLQYIFTLPICLTMKIYYVQFTSDGQLNTNREIHFIVTQCRCPG